MGKINYYIIARYYFYWVFRQIVRSLTKYRSSQVFLGKSVPKICSKFTVAHLCQSAISIKLPSNFIEIALRHGCSPVNLLYIFRTPFSRKTSGWLLLKMCLPEKIEKELWIMKFKAQMLYLFSNSPFWN